MGMKLFIQATTKSGEFVRAGRKWTKAGTVVDGADFTETQAKAIQREPNLKVREATPEEIAAAQTSTAAPMEADVIDAVLAAIPQLADEDFTSKGLPDMGKLREAVDADPKLVTAEVRDAAMNKLIEGGFKAPSKASS
jgi:hypothetical protein